MPVQGMPDYRAYTEEEREAALHEFIIFFAQAREANRALTRPVIDQDSVLWQLHLQAEIYTRELRASLVDDGWQAVSPGSYVHRLIG